MSILKRFRDRKNGAMQFTVPLPAVENPEIELTVKRMSQAIRNNATIDARGTMRRLGISKPIVPMFVDDPEAKNGKRLHPEWEEYNREFNAWFAYHLVDQGRDHFTNWKALDGQELEKFSKGSFTDFVSFLDIDEKQTLGFSYLIQVGTADKEREESDSKKEQTEPAS